MDSWDKLRAGRVSEALDEMIAHCDRSPRNISVAIQYGVAQMLLGEWHLAWCHFRDVGERISMSTDVIPKFAGTARWCEGERESAVREWKRGLDAEYTDPSGGVTIPLHLFFAGIVCPDLVSNDEICDLLEGSKRARSWTGYPGLLARVALGELDARAALQEAESMDPHGKKQHHREVTFWKGINDLASGRRCSFLKKMAFVSDLDWSSFDRDKSDFIDTIWSSEFFLARHHSGDDNM